MLATPAASPEQITLHATSPREGAAVSGFLDRTFDERAARSLAAERHMRWKYWTPRSDWPGSRSFIAMRRGAIVAHAAAWPVRMRVPGREIPAAHLIDWASDPRSPGAGTWLLRQIRRKVRLLLATGGSEITRQLLPIVGFRPLGEVSCFARPLRPIQQALTDPHRTWRLPARLLRNTCWRLVPPLADPPGWSALPCAPADVPPDLWPRPAETTAVTARDAACYRYIVSSPIARHALFVLTHRAMPVGYFCLAYASRAARIADLWLRSTDAAAWCAAYRMAAYIASHDRSICEVSAWASTEVARAALRRAGFRLRDSCVLSACGDARDLDGRELHVQMLDSDASFLSSDVVSYLT